MAKIKKAKGSISRVLSALLRDGHSSRDMVAHILKHPTRKPDAKTSIYCKAARFSYLGLLLMGFTLPILLPVSQVRSYRTVSPLPTRGGILSVALSVSLRCPGVTRHLRFCGARTFLVHIYARDHPTLLRGQT